jgi:hypothetical protein
MRADPIDPSECPPAAPPVPPSEDCPCLGTEPLTLSGEDCDGAPVPVDGMVGTLMQVVQAPGTVFKVQTCDPAADRELVKRCDPDSGDEILFQWDVSVVPPELLSATNLNTGAPFTGDAKELVSCGGGADVEQEVFCDNGTPFIRWFVMDSQGKPTGTYFDTDYKGVAYTPVESPLPIVRGDCVAATIETISSATGDDLSALLPGKSFSFTKPECCVVEVDTSIGSFILGKGVQVYSTRLYESPFTVNSVTVISGACTPASVNVIQN